jgi:hypothetical protein
MKVLRTALLAMLALVPASYGAPIVGNFNMTFGSVVVSLGEIDFTPTNPGPAGATQTYGDFTMDPGASRSGSFLNAVFSALPNDGLIGDLSSNPADGANYVPVGVETSRTRYITLAEQPNWQFVLTYLVPGQNIGGAPSPFFLTQSGNNVSATFSIYGIACDSADVTCASVPDSEKSNWTAIISAQYTNTTVDSLISTVLGGGSLPDNSWSGTFSASPIPEPGTYAMLLSGGLLVGISALRRRRKA